MSALPHIKLFKDASRVKQKTNADMSKKQWLKYWHRCNHRWKRRLMHEIDALPLNFNHTTVYAHVVVAYNRPKLRNCANTDNIVMTTDLMVISYYKC